MTTTTALPGPAGLSANPSDDALGRLEVAVGALSGGPVSDAGPPRREKSASIPLRRDDVTVEAFTGHRVPHNVFPGPATGGCGSVPASRWTRCARSPCG